MRKIFSLGLFVLIGMVSMMSCAPTDEAPKETNSTVSPVTSPYLICANRNPGGIVFDFVVGGNTGAAYNADQTNSVEWDLRVQVYKGVTNDGGTLMGKPFVKLYSTTVLASNVATVTNTNTTSYAGITAVTTELTNTLVADTLATFDLSAVSNDNSGNLYYNTSSGLKTYYDQMVIGENWKSPVSKQEKMCIYVIKTREGRHVKLIIKTFGKNSSVGSGYIAIDWALID